ncbi:hypothetical protein [Roseovarius sp. D0-M9]|uniref:hypothetical protein n=1 Tax=Roseovarius sp. D0-M9 TaxID=3127117 RepID=UPI00300FCECC
MARPFRPFCWTQDEDTKSGGVWASSWTTRRVRGMSRMVESFNYISFGNWENVEGNVDVVTMLRGRMFEYTPSDTEKRLESLDDDAIAFLETLPTFL